MPIAVRRTTKIAIPTAMRKAMLVVIRIVVLTEIRIQRRIAIRTTKVDIVWASEHLWHHRPANTLMQAEK